MPLLTDLHDRKRALTNEATAINDRAQAQRRGLTDAEKRTFAGIIAKLDEVKADIGRESERIDALAPSRPNMQPPAGTAPSGVPTTPEAAAFLARMFRR